MNTAKHCKVGICDMHITVGSKEQKAFSEAQNYLKATQQVNTAISESGWAEKGWPTKWRTL